MYRFLVVFGCLLLVLGGCSKVPSTYLGEVTTDVGDKVQRTTYIEFIKEGDTNITQCTINAVENKFDKRDDDNSAAWAEQADNICKLIVLEDSFPLVPSTNGTHLSIGDYSFELANITDFKAAFDAATLTN